MILGAVLLVEAPDGPPAPLTEPDGALVVASAADDEVVSRTGTGSEIGDLVLAAVESRDVAATPRKALPQITGTVEPAAATRTIAVATGQEAAPTGIVTGNVVNLRDGPSTAYSPVGQVREGDTLEMTGLRDGAWVQILRPGTSVAAWMHGDYIDEM